MSAASTTIDPVRVFCGAQEEARNPGVIDFSFETAIPVVGFDGHRFAVRVRSTSNGLEEIRGNIARLEERALQAEANLRHVEGERRLSEKRADAAEARIKALEAEQAEALSSVAGFEVLPADETTYTVSCGGATMIVTGSASDVAHVVKLAYGGFEYGVSA